MPTFFLLIANFRSEELLQWITTVIPFLLCLSTCMKNVVFLYSMSIKSSPNSHWFSNGLFNIIHSSFLLFHPTRYSKLILQIPAQIQNQASHQSTLNFLVGNSLESTILALVCVSAIGLSFTLVPSMNRDRIWYLRKFFWQHWGLNSWPYTCWAVLELLHQPFEIFK
jgi:hypothetical protein